MKVIDLRPVWEKAFLSKWEKSHSSRSKKRRLSFVGRTWADFMDFWINRRVSRRKFPGSKPFLVSIGNLALGGTGKTPVIMALARSLARDGIQGAVLTRGYKSPLAGPVLVDPEMELAGDEARLMASRLGDLDWPVVQARRRLEGLVFLQKNLPDLDVVLLEDCHQTGDVGRHLDIVILDDWMCRGQGSQEVLVPQAGAVFPLGPYRESTRGASRAGMFLVESPTEVPCQTPEKKTVARFVRVAELRPASTDNSGAEPCPRFGLVSGIARPQPFEKISAELVGAEPSLSVRLQDHQAYGPRLVQTILGHFAENNISTLVTTEKDWVKLRPFWPGKIPAQVVRLEIEWGKSNTLPQLVKERVKLHLATRD